MFKIISGICILLLIGTCLVPVATTQTTKLNIKEQPSIDEGILFAPIYSKTTYLIDKNGTVDHTWSSDYFPGMAAYLLDDGSIIRTTKLALMGAGAGGGIQKITWDNTLVWNFEYYTSDYLSHHDIEILPNGNILMIAWETKTQSEAIQAGRDPLKLMHGKLEPGHIIEVKQTGPTTGEIVWEWHSWDHLIQDFDSSKDNYGVVAEHPELIDLNYGPIGSDWLHINSIDYNEEFDQILLSVHNFNEIWIIDHSTTKEEASNHTGGIHGKGGDILYRWGNPMTYDTGLSSDKKLFGQHDARWIEEGCPGEGNILIFNNGVSRPGEDLSSVDEIVPPVDIYGNYYLEPGSAYGPEEQIWIYNTNFYSHYVGGAQRLPNGNTIICNGANGIFFEINPDKEIIWEYTNPFPSFLLNDVFKVEYYLPKEPEVADLDCDGSLRWNNIPIDKKVTGDFQIKNIGESNSLLNWIITEYPDWGIWKFSSEFGENLAPEDGPVTIQVNIDVSDEIDNEFEGIIRIENQVDSEDFDTIPVYLKAPRKIIASTIICNILSYLFKLI